MQKDVTLWQTVFFITAGIYFFGNFVFIVFSSGFIQPWNNEGLKKPVSQYLVENTK